MSCSVNVTFNKKDLLVFKKIVSGILLLLSIREHCLAKNELNSSALRLKSVLKLFLWKTRRNISIIQERFKDSPICFRTSRRVLNIF